MAAAAFKAVVKLVGDNGRTLQYPCTVSDVAAANYVFQDASNDTTLPSDTNWRIADVVLSAAGTDTTTADIFVNGKSTGEAVMNAANLATNLSRQFMGAPVGIQAGARLRFIQRA